MGVCQGNNILNFQGFQYLTLYQWKQFFGEPEIKDGDYGFFWDNEKTNFILSKINGVPKLRVPYYVSDVGAFANFQLIDITKPLDKQIEDFLSVRIKNN